LRGAHAHVERWSRGASPLHSLDARAKMIALVVLLAAIATTPAGSPWMFCGFFALLLAAIFFARLPFVAMLARAALVLPFSAVFVAMAWWSAGPRAAFPLVAKSFLSVLAALLVAASTPWPRLLDALALLRVPRPLVLVTQFLGRYLFVVTEQALQMRRAAQSRQGVARKTKDLSRHFHAAAGAVGVLFARSSERADGIYHAMVARGFTGRFPAPTAPPFALRDTAFLFFSIAAALAIRLAL
jgi:cobalt/nickel transport system permease protein